MYEIAVALKYLLPRWRQLSVSVIGIISIFVISIVVWLSVVFFSTEESIVRRWTEKLIAVTAPIRLTPTPEYFNSYYYRIDTVSEKSRFTPKSLYEKLNAKEADPYDPNSDQSLDPFFPKPYRDANGKLIDLVQETKKSILTIPGTSIWPFESAFANIRIYMNRKFFSETTQETISQSAYIVNIDPVNAEFSKALVALSQKDINNIFEELQRKLNTYTIITPSPNPQQVKELASLMRNFFTTVEIHAFKTPSSGWLLPRSFIPEQKLFCTASYSHGKLQSLLLPRSQENYSFAVDETGELTFRSGMLWKEKEGDRIYFQGDKEATPTSIDTTPIYLESGVELSGKPDFDLAQLETNIAVVNPPLFSLTCLIQDVSLQGTAPITGLIISRFEMKKPSQEELLWVSTDPQKDTWVLPHNTVFGQGVLLPRTFRDAGVLVGDPGFLLYTAFQATSMQEMRLPIFVAGFYDPGILPVGGRLIITSQEVVSQIHAAVGDDMLLPTGLNVHFAEYKDAPQIKQAIVNELREKKIDKFWNVETYDNYDFTKDIFQQMQSDRNLFTLISIIIIIVACSNIVSMLVILVHDKRKEIAILRALGASRLSIGCIFGICGFFMGAIGSIIGSILALITLYNLPTILGFISAVQGFEVFNAAFYGNIVTATLSPYALWFVVVATSCASMIAGIVPALKAAFVNTSDALRNE